MTRIIGMVALATALFASAADAHPQLAVVRCARRIARLSHDLRSRPFRST